MSKIKHVPRNTKVIYKKQATREKFGAHGSKPKKKNTLPYYNALSIKAHKCKEEKKRTKKK